MSPKASAHLADHIAMADELLRHHAPHRAICSCGRPLPCPIADTCVRRRADFVAAFALVDATTELEIVPPVAVAAVTPAGLRQRLRAVVGPMGGWRHRRPGQAPASTTKT